MEKLNKVYENPSGADSLSNYMGETPEADLYIVLGRNRDSDLLSESNWECALKRLGGESETVEIHSFGHWACGWLEYMCVREKSKEYDEALKIEDELPVLDEDDWCEREDEAAQKAWKEWWDNKARLEYVRNRPDEFYFDSFSDMLKCIRGKYFCGYAGELLRG